MTQRPNILFIMADQLAPQVMPAYHHPHVRTPNIDRLVERGVVFDNAYCNFPLCAPARFSMLSGQLATRIGAFDNAVEFPASTPTFVHDLRLGGYRTCLAGKMHFVGPDQLHGYEERVTTDIYPSHFLWTPNADRAENEWVEWYHSMRAALDAGPFRRSINIAYDEEVTFEAVRWLHEYADAGDERPFFLTVSYFSPHDPYLAPAEYWDAYEGVPIDDLLVGDIPIDQRDAHSRRLYYATGRHMDSINPQDIQRMRRAYYALVTYIDDQVGHLLHTLDAIGAAGDTVIVFTSDHGDMLGERGLFFKMSFHEWSSRVPLIIAQPQARPESRVPARVSSNVSHLDLYPTLLELALGDDAPQPVSTLDGSSLVPLMNGNADSATDAADDIVFAEYTAEATPGPLFMVKQGSLKYICGPHDEPLLYDLANDPLELNNVVGHANYASQQAQLVELVEQTWDANAVELAMRASQANRQRVGAALDIGQRATWDHQPQRDASKTYYRDLDAVQDAYSTPEK